MESTEGQGMKFTLFLKSKRGVIVFLYFKMINDYKIYSQKRGGGEMVGGEGVGVKWWG